MDALSVAQRLGGGTFLDDLHFNLTEVSEQVVVTGRPGTVTVTLKIEPVKGEPAVTIASALKQSRPAADPKGAIFYAVGDGQLEKNDPRQVPMEFRVVPDLTSDVRSVGLEASELREVGNDD